MKGLRKGAGFFFFFFFWLGVGVGVVGGIFLYNTDKRTNRTVSSVLCLNIGTRGTDVQTKD